MFLVRYEDHQWSPWSKDLKDFKQNRNKIQKNQERPLLTVLNYYSSNYSELSQNSESLSMENQNFCRQNLFDVWVEPTGVTVNIDFLK